MTFAISGVHGSWCFGRIAVRADALGAAGLVMVVREGEGVAAALTSRLRARGPSMAMFSLAGRNEPWLYRYPNLRLKA